MDFNNVSNDDTKTKILNIGLVMMLAVGVIFVIFTINIGDDNQVQDEYNNDDKEIKQEENEIQPPVEEEPSNDEPIEEEIPKEEVPEEESKPEQTPSTTNPSELKCTKTVTNEYGKFVYTNKYTFKNNQMVKGTVTVKATLNKSYIGYRNSLIQSLKDENKKFVKLDGISESVSKTSNGFTYTFKLNANKLSKKELAEMGYRTLNYSGVKIAAYDQGYKCEA